MSHAEQDQELISAAQNTSWEIDLDQEVNVFTGTKASYRLVRTVEQEEDCFSDIEPPPMIDKVYWSLYREMKGDAEFCSRWYVSLNNDPESIKLQLRAFVTFDSRSRRPGAYRMANGRVEVMTHNRLAEELVDVYAANDALTEKVRDIFGGDAVAMQKIRAYAYTAEAPLLDREALRNRAGDEIPLCIDTGGQLSFISLRF